MFTIKCMTMNHLVSFLNRFCGEKRLSILFTAGIHPPPLLSFRPHPLFFLAPTPSIFFCPPPPSLYSPPPRLSIRPPPPAGKMLLPEAGQTWLPGTFRWIFLFFSPGLAVCGGVRPELSKSGPQPTFLLYNPKQF